MNEKASEIATAAFANPEERRLATGGMLARYQAQPRREIATTAKRGSRTDGRDDGRRAEGTNAGDRHEPLTRRVEPRDVFNLSGHLRQPLIDRAPFFAQGAQQSSQAR